MSIEKDGALFSTPAECYVNTLVLKKNQCFDKNLLQGAYALELEGLTLLTI